VMSCEKRIEEHVEGNSIDCHSLTPLFYLW